MSHNTGNRGPGGEVFIPVVISIAVIFIVVARRGWRDARLHWLVDHHVLLPAGDHPLWTLPGGIGGLDAARLFAVVLILAVVVTCLATILRRVRDRGIQRRLLIGDHA